MSSKVSLSVLQGYTFYTTKLGILYLWLKEGEEDKDEIERERERERKSPLVKNGLPTRAALNSSDIF